MNVLVTPNIVVTSLQNIEKSKQNKKLGVSIGCA